MTGHAGEQLARLLSSPEVIACPMLHDADGG
ncbi:hypothetical protein M2163_000991 [Streptomyces sp. SAI-135]|nr:hypothetical protein [Streptomyces sp. SAI-090]MDH6573383.1 hypothetical protein [Streptomyces sp. SAI-117]MDH6613883.1 hypothetical protein [Streptomyces sp. SAI-135]